MSEYEELKKRLYKENRESAKRFGTPGQGTGDEKLARNNRDMQRLKESEASTLRQMQAQAPASERDMIDHTLAETEREAREFRDRADYYDRKRNKGS
jgi:hypothetical protein